MAQLQTELTWPRESRASHSSVSKSFCWNLSLTLSHLRQHGLAVTTGADVKQSELCRSASVHVNHHWPCFTDVEPRMSSVL